MQQPPINTPEVVFVHVGTVLVDGAATFAALAKIPSQDEVNNLRSNHSAYIAYQQALAEGKRRTKRKVVGVFTEEAILNSAKRLMANGKCVGIVGENRFDVQIVRLEESK